jgi:hypothetical protein
MTKPSACWKDTDQTTTKQFTDGWCQAGTSDVWYVLNGWLLWSHGLLDFHVVKNTIGGAFTAKLSPNLPLHLCMKIQVAVFIMPSEVKEQILHYKAASLQVGKDQWISGNLTVTRTQLTFSGPTSMSHMITDISGLLQETRYVWGCS